MICPTRHEYFAQIRFFTDKNKLFYCSRCSLNSGFVSDLVLWRTIDSDYQVTSRQSRLTSINPVSECYPLTVVRWQTNVASRYDIPHSDQGDVSCYRHDIDVSCKLLESRPEMCHYKIPHITLFPRCRCRSKCAPISRSGSIDRSAELQDSRRWESRWSKRKRNDKRKGWFRDLGVIRGNGDG